MTINKNLPTLSLSTLREREPVSRQCYLNVVGYEEKGSGLKFQRRWLFGLFRRTISAQKAKRLSANGVKIYAVENRNYRLYAKPRFGIASNFLVTDEVNYSTTTELNNQAEYNALIFAEKGGQPTGSSLEQTAAAFNKIENATKAYALRDGPNGSWISPTEAAKRLANGDSVHVGKQSLKTMNAKKYSSYGYIYYKWDDPRTKETIARIDDEADLANFIKAQEI